MIPPDYGLLGIHRRILRDTSWVEAFDVALRKVVTPGSCVLDLGTGSGILAMLAARAGARRVIAVERTGVAELARQLVEVNGFGWWLETGPRQPVANPVQQAKWSAL